MGVFHKDLTTERWNKLSIFDQMANIGSEVNRSINWKNKNNQEYKIKAFERALELFDLTISDPKNKKQVQEIYRARELFCDYIIGVNLYKSRDKQWQKYFYYFNLASAKQHKD